MNDKEIKSMWEEYYPKVYGYYYRRVNNKTDVEDLTSLVMTAYISVMSDLHKRTNITKPNAYLWKVAHNQLNTFLVSKYKHPVIVGFNDDLDSLDITLDKKYCDRYNSKVADLIQCLESSLPVDDYQLIVKLVIEEYSSQEVADLTGLTSSNVRQRLSRGLKKLRTACQSIYLASHH